MAASTKSALKKVLKKGYVTVNDQLATTATFIKGGEIIQLTIPNEIKSTKKLIFPLQVIYEDDYLAIVYKPAGILVSGNSFKTIANALPQNIQQSKLPDATIPQPVHRLDYGTTGALLIGKTNNAVRLLNKLFENKEIKKTYYAVAIGKMPLHRTISTPIDLKESLTDYSVQEAVFSEKYEILNLVKLTPKTGRRHQIRKHLANIGTPILGDQDYGKKGFILKGKGIYLHAYSLEFIHPFFNKKLYFTATIPKKFTKIFSKLDD
ncbi:Ribosomal large subunit pseudouridine synthase D [Tenacibaculum sp. 190524A02b]|uniref:RluA family pseudouridine synthase n=1 Tax=Tenacibaculum vairaonense TaxID=3137860 RepID=UPI0032B17A09